MKRDNWPVEDEGIRPAGESDRCFYCHEPKGGIHKPDCVVRQRTVVIKVSIDLVVTTTEDWGKELIEFKYNDGIYCMSNIVDNIVALRDRQREQDNGCLCDLAEVKFIREASREDEGRQLLFIKELPS